MDICLSQQAIERERKAPETNDEKANPEERHDDDVFEKEASQGSSSRSFAGGPNAKRKYVPTPASKNKSNLTHSTRKLPSYRNQSIDLL